MKDFIKIYGADKLLKLARPILECKCTSIFLFFRAAFTVAGVRATLAPAAATAAFMFDFFINKPPDDGDERHKNDYDYADI